MEKLKKLFFWLGCFPILLLIAINVIFLLISIIAELFQHAA